MALSLKSAPTDEERPMNDDFAPGYVKFFSDRNPNQGRSSMPWWAWGLVNILSLATMYALLWALPDTDADLFIMGLFIIAPPFAAGFIDGRKGVVGVLTLSGWAVMLAYMVAFSFTEGWQRDCGLGRGFAMYFAMIGALIYPVVQALIFALGRLPARLLRP